jgi:putative NADH-flavin reductase
MKIVLIGASGYVGSAILAEALQRGHDVTALVRNIQKVMPRSGVTPVAVDVLDTANLASALSGHAAVISAFSGHAQTQVRDYYVRGLQSIIEAVKLAEIPRLLVVGGAGSLNVAPGVQLVDTPQFPPQWKGTAEGARDALAILRAEQALNWTVLSPSALLEPGVRTGKFRLGGEDLLLNAQGESYVSVEDYAVAMLDELERPAHPRQRFTVGY